MPRSRPFAQVDVFATTLDQIVTALGVKRDQVIAHHRPNGTVWVGGSATTHLQGTITL